MYVLTAILYVYNCMKVETSLIGVLEVVRENRFYFNLFHILVYLVSSNIVKGMYYKICVICFMEGLAIHILKLKLKEVTTKVMKKTSLQLRGNAKEHCIKILWGNQLYQS